MLDERIAYCPSCEGAEVSEARAEAQAEGLNVARFVAEYFRAEMCTDCAAWEGSAEQEELDLELEAASAAYEGPEFEAEYQAWLEGRD